MPEWLFHWPANAGIAIALLATVNLFLAGCTGALGLYAPGIERVCARRRCYLRADADTVNERCTKGKTRWDDGTPYDPSGDRRARCCTVLASGGRRYKLWVAKGEEECLAHEECHIETWEDDGHRFVAINHSRCHEFGLGRGRKAIP